MALWSDGERCHGVITDAGPIAAAATVLATGGAAALWRRTTNPRGRSAPGRCSRRPPAPTSPTSSSASSTRPRWPCRAPRFDGVLITEAIRGEGAKPARRRRRALHRRAGAARRGHGGDPRPDARPTGADSVSLDLREIDPARFPNVFASLAEAGLDPRASRSRSPRPPTTRWAGSRSTSTAAPRCRASTPSASAPARACTAPTGSPPTRSASASSSAAAPPRRGGARSRAARPPAAARVALRAARPRRPATPSGAAPGRCATPTTWRELLADPYPLARRDRDLRPGPARVARRPPADRLPRAPTPRLDGIHFVLAADGETAARSGAEASVDAACCSESMSAAPSPTRSCSTAARSTPPRSRPRREDQSAGVMARSRRCWSAPAPRPATSRSSPTG